MATSVSLILALWDAYPQEKVFPDNVVNKYVTDADKMVTSDNYGKEEIRAKKFRNCDCPEHINITLTGHLKYVDHFVPNIRKWPTRSLNQ